MRMTRHLRRRETLHDTERTGTTMNANDIKRIAVVGAGLMGHGIALEFASQGYTVHLHDRDQAQLDRARDSIAQGLARLVEIERVTSKEASAAPARIIMGRDLRS